MDNIQYDEGFKSMFAYKALLAITLKALIPEYKDSSVEDIRDKYIQGDPVGNSDRINISGTGVEDGKVKYDIRFDSLLPEPTGTDQYRRTERLQVIAVRYSHQRHILCLQHDLIRIWNGIRPFSL